MAISTGQEEKPAVCSCDSCTSRLVWRGKNFRPFYIEHPNSRRVFCWSNGDDAATFIFVLRNNMPAGIDNKWFGHTRPSFHLERSVMIDFGCAVIPILPAEPAKDEDLVAVGIHLGHAMATSWPYQVWPRIGIPFGWYVLGWLEKGSVNLASGNPKDRVASIVNRLDAGGSASVNDCCYWRIWLLIPDLTEFGEGVSFLMCKRFAKAQRWATPPPGPRPTCRYFITWRRKKMGFEWTGVAWIFWINDFRLASRRYYEYLGETCINCQVIGYQEIRWKVASVVQSLSVSKTDSCHVRIFR